MEKTFIIAKRSLINKKLVTVLSMILVVILIGKLNQNYGFLNGLDKGIFVILIMLFFTLPIIFVLIAGKNYKKSGHLIFNNKSIIIDTVLESKSFKIADLEYIKLKFKGVYGEDVVGYVGGLASMYSRDGSGNILEFKHNGKVHSINIVFESIMDFNAIKHLFKIIKKEYNIQLNIINGNG